MIQIFLLVLVSKAEDTNQRLNDFKRFHLENYFKIMEVISGEKPKRFIYILKKFNVYPEQCLIVGDYVKSEIKEGNKIGAMTVEAGKPMFWIVQIADVSKKLDLMDFENFGRVMFMGHTVTGTGIKEASKIVNCWNPDDIDPLNRFNRNNKIYVLVFSSRLKQGVVVINLSGRALADEKCLSEALRNGQVSQYVFETETIKSSPFDNIRGAIALKQLSGYTQESINRSKLSWVTNIANMAGVSTS